jgi:hypothetical protein
MFIRHWVSLGRTSRHEGATLRTFHGFIGFLTDGNGL